MALAARAYNSANANHGSTGNTIPQISAAGSAIDIFSQTVTIDDGTSRNIKYIVVFLKNTQSGSVAIDVTDISLSGNTDKFKLDGLPTGTESNGTEECTRLISTKGTALIPGDNDANSNNRGYLSCQVTNGFGVDQGDPTLERK